MSGILASLAVGVFCGLIALGAYLLAKNAIEREESAKKKPKILG